jgi:FixJ family two-component response regulator
MEATPPTIFVVDDDASLRRALARLLHSCGLQVETFASGHEFLARRIPDGPACLVLDVRLAEENGLALQEVLRTSPRRLPIIFLSGYGTIPLCVQALKAGAVNFLQKPVEEPTLLEAIAQALAQDQGTHETRALYAGLAQRAATLTPREREVMALVVTGLLNKQIAAALGTSEKTIKIHRAQVMRKMQAASLAALVRMADAVDLGSEYDPNRVMSCDYLCPPRTGLSNHSRVAHR